ncbi:flagellar hook-length control protein FliK [Pseudomonas jinjuensis]|uniref:Hook-length control protein FliK n=1 Tax=Pseudomonas jinjuensis TaxID=198616 RepID=A0A1H0HZM5_9PSED|nr:flagellar hook-length control protein FliK [Pseudomonas jinjuensis]SDO24603.1 hook-length control protein FliK [Pseudomonas jinjuensis]
MPSEIGAIRPLPSLPPPRSQASAVEVPLQLLRSLGDLLPPGSSATAEVLGVKAAQASFQLLLRLTLADGRQTIATAESPQPLAQGSQLNIAALSPTRLAASLLAQRSEAPLTQIDLDQLPPGTLLQGKVLSSERIESQPAQQPLYRVLLRVLDSPLAERVLSLESARPLSVGSLLSAQVQASQALLFLPPSARMERLEIGRQLATQQGRQAALPALFDALRGLDQADGLPSGLRQAVDSLLAGLPDARQLADPRGLAQALLHSGGFLESGLLHGAPGQHDFKANLLRLIATLLPSQATINPALLASLGDGNRLPALLRGTLGQIGGRGEEAAFPLSSRLLAGLQESGDLETLLKLAAAAVARLQTHQLSSLAQSDRLPDGTLLTTWQTEIPMRQQSSVTPLQVRIQQEDRSAAQEQQGEMIWHVELAFDLDSLGPLQVQASLARGAVSSQLWAERESTASLIDHELDNLRQRLCDAGLSVNQLSCRQGKPPRGERTAVEQRWVDEQA